jgi:protease secretion system membrane fusion protein
MSEAVINDSAKKSVQDLSSLALGDAGDSSKSTHSGEDKVVWYKRIEQSLSNWIQAWNPYDPKKLQGKGLKPVEIEESDIKKTATRWFLGFFAIFFIWACFAPINGGVTVEGNVSVLGNRKAVQHPTGGVVQEIMVKEGDTVVAGQQLIKINPSRTDADLSTVELAYINLLASESRLKAERDGSGSIVWTEEFGKRFKADDPRAIEAKKLQVQLLNSRRGEYNSQISSLNEQISGLNSVLAAKREQQVSIKEEMVNSSSLAKDGFVPKSQANLAERQNSDIVSTIASTQSDISRLRLQISQAKSAYLKDVDTQLQEIQKNREAFLLKMDSVKFDRDLAEIKAPVSGSIVGLKVFTVGGVIGPLQMLMEVVPKDEKLVIEAKVPGEIIDKVNVGMDADIHFTSFNTTTTPVVTGVVKVISADKVPTDKPGEKDYYLGQIETSPEGVQKLADLKLVVQPGMPAQIVIKHGERTFMSYLLKPLLEKLSMAFKG